MLLVFQIDIELVLDSHWEPDLSALIQQSVQRSVTEIHGPTEASGPPDILLTVIAPQ